VGEVVNWRNFFSADFSASAQPIPSACHESLILYINRRGFDQGCAFRVSSIRLIPCGSYPQNSLILRTSMGISSLNVYGRTTAQEKRITTLHSSKCASRKDTQCAIVNTKGWGPCRVKLAKVFFAGKFTSKFQSTAENVA
jgi:hypothetical protein